MADLEESKEKKLIHKTTQKSLNHSLSFTADARSQQNIIKYTFIFLSRDILCQVINIFDTIISWVSPRVCRINCKPNSLEERN